MYKHIILYMYICIYIHVYMYIYMYIHVYINMYMFPYYVISVNILSLNVYRYMSEYITDDN